MVTTLSTSYGGVFFMKKNKWSVKTLVFMSLLAALNLILTRIISLDLGPFRVTVGPVCTIMAGLWLGPMAGAACGFCADIIGALLKGYAINPFITMAAMVWGIIPALMKNLYGSKPKSAKIAILAVSIAFSSITATLLLNTVGLVLINGYSLMAILPGRILQVICYIPMYTILVSILYYSPLTHMVLEPTMMRHKNI